MALVGELKAEADECIAQIDGGEECRGRDSRLSDMADLLQQAATRITNLHGAVNLMKTNELPEG